MGRFDHENEKVEDIYITKYWESRGLLRVGAKTYTSEGHEYADVPAGPGRSPMFLGKSHWVRSYEEACDRVATLAMNRINGLKASLERARKTKDSAVSYTLAVEVLETTGSSR
jgi:hypothetical protein